MESIKLVYLTARVNKNLRDLLTRLAKENELPTYEYLKRLLVNQIPNEIEKLENKTLQKDFWERLKKLNKQEEYNK